MKIQKKYLILMLFVAAVFVLVCCNSKKNNVKEEVVEEPEIDEYAVLFNTNTSNRATENLSGEVILITENDFIEKITVIDNPKGFQYVGQTPCIVELYADRCKACIVQTGLMNEMAPDYKGKVIFYRLDIDRAYGVANAFKVKNIPMILYFKPRGKFSTTVGYLNKVELTDMIDKLLLNP